MHTLRTLRASLLSLFLIVMLVSGVGLAQAQDGGFDQPDPATGYLEGGEAFEPMAAAASYPGSPAYDSGWQAINPGQTLTLTHNLAGSIDDYVVDLRFNSTSTAVESHGFNQTAFGGDQLMAPVPTGYAVDDSVGAYWYALTTGSVKVHRQAQDKTYADQIRLRIYVVSSADYDSGWTDVTAAAAKAFPFTIDGGSADNYLVYMEFKDTGLINIGVHQRYYGGFSLANNDTVGTYWRNLTDSSIVVYRRSDDAYSNKVRIRIWSQVKPTYDSGWVAATPGYYRDLAHNIGGNPDDYIVDLQQKDSIGNGINQRCYGGCDLRANDGGYANTKQGAYWRNLTSSAIQVGRRVDDKVAEQVRVRIWNVWKPTPPVYDSGLQTSPTGTAMAISHNVGGDADNYLVDFDYVDSVWKVNQLYYGMKAFGAHAPAEYAENDSAGAYWRSLNNSTLTIFRGHDDQTADQWRVRIWPMPKPDYDSGWVDLTAGSAKTYIHNLIGDPSDFLVDVTLNDTDGASGKNQRYLGGSVASTDKYYGVHWHSFKTTAASHSLILYRYPDDVTADQARVRIWRIAAPTYESGYLAYTAGTTQTLTHGVGVDAKNMLVDVTANQASGDHKVFYGRVDIGAGSPFPAYAENDRVGFYWFNLTPDVVKVGRLADDGPAGTINVRIWKLAEDPPKMYLPLINN